MLNKIRKKILRTLKIDHIAAVDKPAQQGAVAVLQKNAGGTFQKNSPAPVFISGGVEVTKRVGDERPRRDSFIDHAHGPAHYRLLSRFYDIKNRNPSRLPEENYQEAWNSLAEADRNELRRADAVPNDDLDLTEKGLKDMDSLKSNCQGSWSLANSPNTSTAKVASGISERDYADLMVDYAKRDGRTILQVMSRPKMQIGKLPKLGRQSAMRSLTLMMRNISRTRATPQRALPTAVASLQT